MGGFTLSPYIPREIKLRVDLLEFFVEYKSRFHSDSFNRGSLMGEESGLLIRQATESDAAW